MSKHLKDLLCRTCLTSLSKNSSIMETFNIFNTEDLAKKIMLCASLTVESSDEYPQQVCLECYKQITIFYEFQQMCAKSLDKFKELLKTPEKVIAEKDALDENIKLNYILGQDHTQHVSNKNLNQTLTKIRKRGRPPKKRAEEEKNCENEKKTDCNAANTKIEAISSTQRNFKNKCEVILELEVMSDKIHSNLNSSKNHVNETVTVQNLNNDTKKAIILKEDLLFVDSVGDNEQKFKRRRTYQCDTCNENFQVLHRFQAHKRQHDGLPAYCCTFEGCERSFNRWHYFNEHLKDHKGTHELYNCDVENCERSYKNKSALNIHKRKFHNQGPELKSHMCEICGKVFKSSAVLNDHRFTHIDRTQYPFVCEEPNCTKRFTNKEKLKIHKMRHAGIKNFICPYCDMRKTTRNELKIHINYHTLERTWPCSFCSKVCNSAGNLKMHVKNMHERAKDYACQFCERTFAKADTKKYHEMTHTGEKPHQCKECGRRFVQPAALRTHRKIHLRQQTKNAKGSCSKESETSVETAGDKNVNVLAADI